MSRRRRSLYSAPKLKLKQKTIVAIATLISFGLAALSLVTVATGAPSLQFWNEVLFSVFGWLSFTSPIFFILVGLVLQKFKWGFAQTNVLLGLILILLSLTGLTASLAPMQAGSLGAILWDQLSSFVTGIGSALLLIVVFLVGLVVTFNASLTQIFEIFATLLKALGEFFPNQRVCLIGKMDWKLKVSRLKFREWKKNQNQLPKPLPERM
jgi:hypothetical protein